MFLTVLSSELPPSVRMASNRLGDFLLMLFGAKRLGHGRRTEATILSILFVYALLLTLVPQGASLGLATQDRVLVDNPEYLYLPMYAAAGISLIGLFNNCFGLPYSHPFRFVGALMSAVIFVWFIVKCAHDGDYCNLGFATAIVLFPTSMVVMTFALAGLPDAGSPGQM